MLGEVSQVLDLLSGSVDNLVLGVAGQMVDVFGLLTSGTQMGYADSAFFWSDMFHYRKTYQFARQPVPERAKPTPTRRHARRASRAASRSSRRSRSAG